MTKQVPPEYKKNVPNEHRTRLSAAEKLGLWRRYGSYLPAVHRQVLRLWLEERMVQPDIAVALGLTDDRGKITGKKFLPTQTILNDGTLMMYGMKLMDEARQNFASDLGIPVVVDAD